MTRALIAGAAVVTAIVAVVIALVVRGPAPVQVEPASPSESAAEAHPGFLYGRITATDGAVFEGRLRWGGGEEAFWGDFFDGARPGSPWAEHAPGARRQRERGVEIFGVEFGGDDSSNLGRPFMARFGDIARVDATFGTVQVTLKSGSVFELDRVSAGDFDDGVRVWDPRRGVLDLDARRIRTIEFLPTKPLAGAPVRLHGTVQTRQGHFTGFIQWNSQASVGSDELTGRTTEGEVALRYDTIRAISRDSRESIRVTLVDGREIVVSGTREAGRGHRGIYVEDGRYGRVLISWNTFERLELSPRGSGPGYEDFPPGRPLAGSVTIRGGRRLSGRLVYDFDESETTETFDVPSQDVLYHLPLSLIASIVPAGREPGDTQRPRVILRDGEELQLDRAGDLGERNAGMLIFADGRETPEHVPWIDVERIDLDAPPK